MGENNQETLRRKSNDGKVTLPVVKAYYKPPEFRRVIPKDTRPTGEIQIL